MMMNFILCTPYTKLVVCLAQGGRNGLGTNVGREEALRKT